ncbi:MAG: cellulase family glycosylhydrolase, partial [Thermoleophilaceae bacterium]|nr:cellulase family glycosylhydrolase [Thermoleophilaceae bacterium]
MTTQITRLRATHTLFALLGAVLALAIAAPLASAITAPLNTSTRWMIDNDRRVVMLHGVNMVNKFAPYEPSAIGFGADDADAIAAEGFNTVRLGLAWKAVEPSPGIYDENYLNKIQATTELLAARGIYTLIDFHQDMYNEK